MFLSDGFSIPSSYPFRIHSSFYSFRIFFRIRRNCISVHFHLPFIPFHSSSLPLLRSINHRLIIIRNLCRSLSTFLFNIPCLPISSFQGILCHNFYVAFSVTVTHGSLYFVRLLTASIKLNTSQSMPPKTTYHTRKKSAESCQ